VVDRAALEHGAANRIAALVDAGVDRIQLRDRSLDGRDWLSFADCVSEAARRVRPDVEIFVNRRIDVALAIEADGVHLGFDALEPGEARALLGQSVQIGVSTHDAAEAIAATRAGADYVHLAPVFDPLSKPATRPPLGLAAVREAARGGARVLAQGGVTHGNAADLIRAGAMGVAVTGMVLGAEEPPHAVAALRAVLDEAAASAD